MKTLSFSMMILFFFVCIADSETGVLQDRRPQIRSELCFVGDPDIERTLVEPGSTITFYLPPSISNSGPGVANNVYLAIFLSEDNTIDQNDRNLSELGPITVPRNPLDRLRRPQLWFIMASGGFINRHYLEGIRREVRITIPSDLLKGYYYIGAYIDSRNTCTESDENNNNSRPILISVITSGERKADLRAESLRIDDDRILRSVNFGIGDGCTLRYAVKNNGLETANSFGVVFWLSTDDSLDENDTCLYVTDSITLRPGEIYNENIHLGPPDGINEGNYYLIFDVDYQQVVDEYDEANNMLSQMVVYEFID